MLLDTQRSRTGEKGQKTGHGGGWTRYPDFLASLVDVSVETEPLVGRNCRGQRGGIGFVGKQEGR